MNSVKVLKLCTQVNKELEDREKYFILKRLLEYVNSGGTPTRQEIEFVDLVGDVFGISEEDIAEAKRIAFGNEAIVEESTTIIRDIKDFEKRVLIKNIKGPVFFGFSHRFLISMRSVSEETKAVIFNMSFVPFMDHSGVRTFAEVVQFLKERDIEVCFSGLSGDNLQLLEGIGLIPNTVAKECVFNSIQECVMWLSDPAQTKSIRPQESSE